MARLETGGNTVIHCHGHQVSVSNKTIFGEINVTAAWNVSSTDSKLSRVSSISSAVTDIPHQNTVRTKTRFFAFHHHNKMRDKYIKSRRIDAAITTIQRGEFVHYSPVADKYGCDCSALSWRIRGLTKSKKEANSF